MTTVVNSTDNYSTEKLILVYYFDPSLANNSYTMFEDDGSTYGSIEKDKYELITFKRKHIDDNHTEYNLISIGKGYYGQPEIRSIQLELIGLPDDQGREFEINGVKLHKQQDISNNGYHYDDKNNMWIINFIWKGEEIVIKQNK